LGGELSLDPGARHVALLLKALEVHIFLPSMRGTGEALKPGERVVVNGQRATDGSLTVASVSVRKDGLAPPM